jgi:pyridoxal phosphate enzyme (YggS family)
LIEQRSLGERVESVRQRIAEAAARAGRSPSDVLLVAASKDVPASAIRDAAILGLSDVGENRAQELRDKQLALATDPGAPALRWHFFGALQRNKVRLVVGQVVLVHSVDSIALAESMSTVAERERVVQDVLLEVNVAGEPTKRGVGIDEVERVAVATASLPGLRLRGLMTVPPAGGNRRWFAALRALAEALHARVPGIAELSMGMSDDFEVAVEEGATIVRVGTAIFGARPPHKR